MASLVTHKSQPAIQRVILSSPPSHALVYLCLLREWLTKTRATEASEVSKSRRSPSKQTNQMVRY